LKYKPVAINEDYKLVATTTASHTLLDHMYSHYIDQIMEQMDVNDMVCISDIGLFSNMNPSYKKQDLLFNDL